MEGPKTKIKVTLIRGERGDRVWYDWTRSSARRRADLLGEVHEVVPTQDSEGNWVIDATEWYRV